MVLGVCYSIMYNVLYRLAGDVFEVNFDTDSNNLLTELS